MENFICWEKERPGSDVRQKAPSYNPIVFFYRKDFNYELIFCKPLSNTPLFLIFRLLSLGYGDIADVIIKLQVIAGHILLNMPMRYAVVKRFSVFANMTNTLNQHYRSVGYKMDLSKDTEGLHGQHEDPIKIRADVNFTFNV